MQDETSIKRFYVVEADDVEEAAVPENVPAVRRTMKLHQVVTLVRGSIKYRDVSCCCNNPETLHCTCYSIKVFTFPTRAQPIVTDPLVPPVLPAADVQHVTQVPQTSTVKPASPKQLSLHPDLWPVGQLDKLAEPQGKWCVVRYLGNIYPGIVTDSDEVMCMNSVGMNLFFWPQYRDDVCW